MNTLRILLETKLQEQDDQKNPIEDLSTLPETLTKEFLQSNRQTKINFISDLDDEVNINDNKDFYHNDILSTSMVPSFIQCESLSNNCRQYDSFVSDQINQSKMTRMMKNCSDSRKMKI